MKTLVLTDGGENDALATAIVEKIQSLLGSKGDFVLYNVNQWELKKCVGCFSCWIKSPGLCMFRDECCDINKDDSDCDMLIIVTKICYGCYGPKMKTVLDRLSLIHIFPLTANISSATTHPDDGWCYWLSCLGIP